MQFDGYFKYEPFEVEKGLRRSHVCGVLLLFIESDNIRGTMNLISTLSLSSEHLNDDEEWRQKCAKRKASPVCYGRNIDLELIVKCQTYIELRFV